MVCDLVYCTVCVCAVVWIIHRHCTSDDGGGSIVSGGVGGRQPSQ